MTAASQVFDLPELVQDIVNHIYEQASSNQLQSNDRPRLQPLMPLLLVNKTFYRCDIDMRGPPHSALLNVQPQQRQMYADKIRQISMNQLDDTLMSGYVRFPRLAEFSCRVYAGDAPHGLEHYVSAYLQESLEHLTTIPQAHSLEDDRGPRGPQVPPNLAGLQLPGAIGMQGFPSVNPVALRESRRGIGVTVEGRRVCNRDINRQRNSDEDAREGLTGLGYQESATKIG